VEKPSTLPEYFLAYMQKIIHDKNLNKNKEGNTAMRKILTTVISGIALAILIPASSFAMSSKTDINGTVYNNGVGVSGAHVTVVCDNNAKTDTTDSTGAYLVQFNAAKCPVGATVYVTAKDGHKGGDSSDKVPQGENDKLNVVLINVSLPEFGALAGIGAALLGGGAFLVIRRRQLGETRN
jgi:hypothetical protein